MEQLLGLKSRHPLFLPVFVIYPLPFFERIALDIRVGSAIDGCPRLVACTPRAVSVRNTGHPENGNAIEGLKLVRNIESWSKRRGFGIARRPTHTGSTRIASLASPRKVLLSSRLSSMMSNRLMRRISIFSTVAISNFPRCWPAQMCMP